MNRRYLVLFICALMACACEDFSLFNGENVIEDSSVTEPEKEILELSETEKVLSSEKQDFIVEVTASDEFEFKVDDEASWISVEEVASRLVVSVDANEEYDDRYAAVTVSMGGLSEVLRITQKQKDAVILASDRYEVGKDGGLVRVSLRTNVPVDVTISDDAASWISLNETKGLQDKEIELVVAPSEEPDVRAGEVVITGEEETVSVIIYQAGEPVLVLGEDEFAVTSEGGVVNVEISTNLDYDVTVPRNDWITYEPLTRAIVTGTHKFYVAANESYDARECEIVFASWDGSIVQKVRIVQMQKDAIVLNETAVEIEGRAGTFSLTLASNVDYDVEIDAGWLALSQTKAMVEEELAFAYEANESLEARTAVISFTSGELRQQVTVIQAPFTISYVLGVTHVNQSFRVPFLSGNILEAAVYWGDGSNEEYASGLTHDYVTAEQVRTEVHMEGGEVAPSVSFEDIIGIVEIDLSGM